MKLIITILLGIVVVQASALSTQEHFGKFKVDYERNYECPELEKLRFNIFANTLKSIEENSKLYQEGKVTFELGINEFADLLNSEVPRGLLAPGEEIREPPIQEFEKYKVDFNKQYECPGLEALRFKIFQDSLKAIEEHNKDSTYQWGINQFTDFLQEEIPTGAFPSKDH